MKKIVFAIGALLLLSISPALALLDTTTGSAVDLAPVLNPLIQLVGMLLAGVVSALLLLAVNWVRGKLGLQQLARDSATQAKIDDVAGKIIGGAFARADVKPGQAMFDVKNPIIADAASKIADVLGKEIKDLGATDIKAKAQEMVENRIGLMIAAQNGTPVPGTVQVPSPAPAMTQSPNSNSPSQ